MKNVLVVFVLFVCGLSDATAQLIHGPILTWHTNPSETINVTWVVRPSDDKASGEKQAPIERNLSLWLQKNGKKDWVRMDGESRPFADIENNFVHAVHLKGLEANAEYAVSIASQKPESLEGATRFRTAPLTLDKPLCYVTGGDMGVGPAAQAINRQAGASSPLFALLGGDLAYANGRSEGRWYQWIDNWVKQAVTPEGLSIPIVAVIGNHEMGSRLSEEQAKKLGTHPRSKFFFSLFTLPEGGSRYVLDFGNYMSIYVLDSGYTYKVEEQTEWLAGVMEERKGRPHTFVCYHRPAYGTAKPPNMAIRKEWSPLFEKYDVDAVFENDHHTYKRTFPIRDEKVDHENGVLYLGDGAWGAGPRKAPDLSIRDRDPDARVDPITKREIWHLARAESRIHMWRVTLSEGKVLYEAVDKEGVVFDQWPEK